MATYQSPLPPGVGSTRMYLELNQTSQSTSNNTSTVSYNLYLKGRSFHDLTNTSRCVVTINGQQVYNKITNYDLRNNSTYTLASGTVTIPHNSDGTKTFTFSATNDCSVGGQWNISGSMTLSTIPRRATFNIYDYSSGSRGSAISIADTGTIVNYVVDSPSSSFRYRMQATIAGSTYTIWDKDKNWTSVTHTLPTSWNSAHMANSTSALVTFTLTTYNGNSVLGTYARNFTVTVPGNVVPTISSVTLSEANSNKKNIVGATPYYQLLSTIRVQTSSSGVQGSTIRTTQVTADGKTQRGADVYFSEINKSGTVSFKITVTDSRGRTASATRTATLNAYSVPSINLFNANRASGNSSNGEAKLIATHTSMNGKNPLNIKVSVKETTQQSGWTQKYSATNKVDKFNQTISLGGGYDDYKSYTVRAVISDKFNRMATSIATLPTSELPLVIGADTANVGIGKIPTVNEGLDVKGQVMASDGVTVRVNDYVYSGIDKNGDLIIKNRPIYLPSEFNTTPINDLRDINFSPHYFWTHYSKKVHYAFMKADTVGLNNRGFYFGVQVTPVGWADSSGGVIQQFFIGGARVFMRHSTSDTTWSAWSTIAGGET